MTAHAPEHGEGEASIDPVCGMTVATDPYSINSVTAKKNSDGSMTVHLGGDPKAANYLRTMPGWNYTVRLYRPRAEILSGSWTFPQPQPVG